MKAAATRPHASAVNTVLGRLDGVQRSGNGWRAKCPACGGASRKVSIAEGDDGRVLLHCFGGCDAASVAQAAGLSVSDLFPIKSTEDTPESRRRTRRAAREAQWGAALEMLALEARVVHLAGWEVQAGRMLNPDDAARVARAVERISDARAILRESYSFRPEARH